MLFKSENLFSNDSQLGITFWRYRSVALYRGGTCFCGHTVVQGYTFRLQNYRVGKNRDATVGAPRRWRGRPVPPAAKLSL